MGVQALEAAEAAGAGDPEGKLGPQRPLLRMRPREAPAEIVVGLGGSRPAGHTAAGLDTREPSDQVRARDVIHRRERLARFVERRLLGDCGAAERTARGDTPERTGGPAELTLDDGDVVHETSVVPSVKRQPSGRAATRRCP